jgi:histidine triad (HIT) family protein
MDDCIFCKVVRGELPSTKVYEDGETLAFLDINPVNPGHTLVIPKKHSTDIFEIDEQTWGHVMQISKRIAHALESALSPTGVNLTMNNRAGAGQIVFHAHVHVMPRLPKDGRKLWPGRPYDTNEAAEVSAKIRAKL